ncbi:LOW QUALITY PROTEIN: NAD-dependent protein deacetylase sirtuin-3, mitochondrial [Cyclopterus lumpus]|uniref:LOW QUALITY PROTEIN: NAD-dependent protein deacetylase sirtuin-3, mitochondrial n=1 Tax=Cyclopterus lumpus TaxID=8103 RepID=UPI001486B405|nr:LOW QUALITY PROTEIN: NAD-dependent protein deacetylase sirtuin-3, mitochondrial [Cyclopterus lumpus]
MAPSALSPVRLCRYLSSRAGGRLSQSEGAAAALCRRTHPPRPNGPRGFSSRGGGPAEERLTLEDVAKNIRERRYERVVVMAGAGISTPSGIPDFRSPGSGLYDNLQQYHLPYAEAVFELSFFHQNPRPFFALARELYPGRYRPNPTHYFVRLLHQKRQLLRMYTQNIDGLERRAYSPPPINRTSLQPDVMRGAVPKCPTCTGVVKPDIVFFGEELPRRFFKYLADFPRADLLVVMGTSLEVEPFAGLADAVRGAVPRLLINRDPVGPFAGRRRALDVVQLGDVVAGVRVLVDALGWTRELDALMAATKTEE